MSDQPEIASRTPFPTEVKEGEKYMWCACGRSQNQPFCDGSHKGTGFSPKPYTAPKDKTVFFCGCKHSGSAPICDGTHSSLHEG
jgi:CDGSH-type Zn-finger protein